MKLPMTSFKQYIRTINEGGAMFSDVRINKSEVMPTVKSLEKLTGLKLSDSLLGSTGKSPTSGDIDLVIDDTKLSKDTFIQQLIGKGVDPKDLRKTGIEVAYRAPIIDAQGNKTGNYIQVDFMFHSDPTYLKFYYANDDVLPLKGMHRNVLLSSIAKPKGLLLSSKGLFNRETKQMISKDPHVIATHVLGDDASGQDLRNVPSIMAYLKSHYSPQAVKDMIAAAEETIGFTLV